MKTLIFALGLFWSAILLAAEPATLFENANRLYEEKDFAGARQAYEQIEKEGLVSASLFFNLGNACYKMRDIPSAILYYEKGLALELGNEDLRFNLRLANLQITDKIVPLPEFFIRKTFGKLFSVLSSEGWGIIALSLIWIGFAGGVLYLFAPSLFLRKLGFFTGLFAVLFCLFSFFLSFQQNKQERLNRYAILFDKNVYVKSAPDDYGTDLFLLHEGVKMKIVETRNNWSQIRLEDGKVGWIKTGAYKEI